jgi:hypothetical protein
MGFASWSCLTCILSVFSLGMGWAKSGCGGKACGVRLPSCYACRHRINPPKSEGGMFGRMEPSKDGDANGMGGVGLGADG